MTLRGMIYSAEAAAADGVVKQELEYVFFGKIGNLEALEADVPKEKQEQWSVDGIDGTIRVRAIDDKEYILTTKTWTPGVTGKNECELPTTKDMFEHFKLMAPKGMLKTRYKFPVPDSDLIWEVDVFYNADGTPQEWCKIDFEVPDASVKVPPFPESLQLTDVITNQYGKRTEEENAFIDDLLKVKFSSVNAKL